jgi:hypothetical protein
MALLKDTKPIFDAQPAKMRYFRKLILSTSIPALLLHSCSPKYVPYTGEKAFTSQTGVPDYSKLDYWAAHPDKSDPSDSVPAPLRSELQPGRDVDVFFVHPTTFTDEKDSSTSNASIDDAFLNSKTDNSTILSQASVFNRSARIYAPRYRQAHIHMYFISDSVKKKAAFDLAYSDVRNAFQYYLDHFNNGRPIIIASHSQGTTHTQRLLKEFFSGSTLRNKLVAAYLIGMPVPKNAYPDIPVCRDSTQTGCFVTWRSFRQGYEDRPYDVMDSNTAVVNPLTWSTSPETAPKERNHGAVLYKFNKVYTKTNDATIHGNILWISKPRFPGASFYRSRNYHIGDINLFYLNIREDVQRRVSLFWKR